ncbi:succinate dehydrogenase hydrophobic anchor subunit [Streptomyces glaucescens]
MSDDSSQSPPDRRWLIALAWLWVGVPLAYGVYELVQKVTQLFTG